MADILNGYLMESHMYATVPLHFKDNHPRVQESTRPDAFACLWFFGSSKVQVTEMNGFLASTRMENQTPS